MKFFVSSSKGERELKLPDSWENLTTSKYQQIAGEWDGTDIVKAFSILSGIPFKNLFETKDPELEAQLILATSFLFSQPATFKDQPVPDWFEYDGQKYKVKDLSLSIGQSIHVRQKLDTCKTYDEAISYAIAVSLQPQIDGEFDVDKAQHLERFIGELPITITYPVGFFLLRPLMNLGKITLSRWQRARIRLLAPFTKNAKILHKWQKLNDLSRLNT
jgi:hypothetical protein